MIDTRLTHVEEDLALVCTGLRM